MHVYIYICIYAYIVHTLIAWVQFCPQTTSHVVLNRPGGDCRVKTEMEQEHDRASEQKRTQRDPAR